MTFEIRRVVTTHDAQGKAVVMVDALADNPTSRRAGHQSQLIWMTDATPSDISLHEDMGARDTGRPPPTGGTIFRVLELQPGVAAEMPRTGIGRQVEIRRRRGTERQQMLAGQNRAATFGPRERPGYGLAGQRM